LIAYGIINRTRGENEQILRLFKRDHPIEIRKILTFELLENFALQMQPTYEQTKNLLSRFIEHADQDRSNGVYYFYTEKNDPDSWIVLARLNAKKNPHRYKLGSIKDPNSKLKAMWIATLSAWKGNAKNPIRRGAAEKIDQDAFGNNRQPGFAAFKLFIHAGWLRIAPVSRTSIHYNVVDDKAHQNSEKLTSFTNDILKGWGFDD